MRSGQRTSDGLRSCATPHSRLFPDFGVGPLSFFTSPFNQSWKPHDEPKGDVFFRLRHGITGASVLANLQPAVRRWQDARAPATALTHKGFSQPTGRSDARA
jgi:hypothetical protein